MCSKIIFLLLYWNFWFRLWTKSQSEALTIALFNSDLEFKPLICIMVCIAQSLVFFCVVLRKSLFVLLTFFSFRHCIVYPSSKLRFLQFLIRFKNVLVLLFYSALLDWNFWVYFMTRFQSESPSSENSTLLKFRFLKVDLSEIYGNSL